MCNNPCNPCHNSSCNCRYNGPDIPELGVTAGMPYDEVIEIISTYVSDIDFEDGVGIDSTSYNATTGQLTLNFTNSTSYTTGDLRGPQGATGPQGPVGPAGPIGPSQVIHQNTLYVSKTGSDLTGTRHDITKPFLTITGASAAAQPGDTVVVLPGTYNEGLDNWIVSDVNYYFYPGAVVETSSHCIKDGGVATNIRIFGHGSFVANSGSGVILTNASTTIHMEFETLYGLSDGITLGTCDYVNIKGKYISNSFQYLASIRGNSHGIIDIDIWDGRNSSLGSTTIYVRSHSVDLVERTVTLKGRVLYSNSYSNAIGAIGIGLSGSVNIHYKIEQTIHEDNITSNEYPVFQVSSGRLKVDGVSFTSKTGKGFVLTTDGTFADPVLEVNNVKGKTRREMFRQVSGNNTLIQKSTLYSENPTGAAGIVSGGTSFALIDSVLINDGATDGIQLTNALVNYAFSNTTVITDPAAKSLNTGGAATNVAILNNFISNTSQDGTITNSVTGSAFIVDPQVALTTNLISL